MGFPRDKHHTKEVSLRVLVPFARDWGGWFGFGGGVGFGFGFGVFVRQTSHCLGSIFTKVTLRVLVTSAQDWGSWVWAWVSDFRGILLFVRL